MSFFKKIANLINPKIELRQYSIPEDFSHLYNSDRYFTDEFYSNLAKTIIFTENIISEIEDVSKVNYTTIFRSVNPIYKGKPFYTFIDSEYGYVAEAVSHPFNYEIIFSEALLVKTGTILPEGDLKKFGRILKFENNTTTYDGAAVVESEGFVDNGDCPPIDTWFYITKSHLYCWIPAIFLEQMQNAIEVEPLGSYSWLDEENPFFYLETFKRLEEMR
jgi:hypothetical protein